VVFTPGHPATRTGPGLRFWIKMYVQSTSAGAFLLFRSVAVVDKARAASTDRRPVDPPPVVELHIYEGEDWETRQDITFHYNANFFLYTTLAHSRKLVHGRVNTPAATNPPVLSGTPVSGMAYLDRPNPAGYFIFPDLSVRHEGRYHLSMCLYEQTKNEADEDEMPPPPDSVSPCGNFWWRMTIKSMDFTVYSAKKFPGLQQSTSLSRLCAEQGCRIRIRRDVRMRRRDGKRGAAADREDEEGLARGHRRRASSPAEPLGRASSMSNESTEGGPHGHDVDRRPSHASNYPVPPLSGGPRPAAGHMAMPYAAPNAHQYPPHGAAHPLAIPSPEAPIKQSPSVPVSPAYANYLHATSMPNCPAPPPPPSPHAQFHGQRERPLSRDQRSNSYGSGCDYRRDSGYRRPSLEAPHPAGYAVDDRRLSLSGAMDCDMPRTVGRPHADSLGARPACGLRSLYPVSEREGLPSPTSAAPERPLYRSLKIMEIVNHELSLGVKPDRPGEYQTEARGKKRQRDEREPGRIVDGARQPDDLTKQDRLPFYRANGALDVVECHEHI
jgi:hypothetical protein